MALSTESNMHQCHPLCAHPARIPTIATCVPRAGFAWVTKKLKQESVLGIPLCTTNRINMPQTAEDLLAGGSAVSMCVCMSVGTMHILAYLMGKGEKQDAPFIGGRLFLHTPHK